MPTANPALPDRPRIGTKYRQYKAATEKVALWLASTARGLGGEKAAKSAPALTIAQFVTFTDSIIEANPKVEIPYEILALAETAFHFRQERARLLKGFDLESDKRHQYVIDIIREVAKKLRAHYRAAKQAASKPKATSDDTDDDEKAEADSQSEAESTSETDFEGDDISDAVETMTISASSESTSRGKWSRADRKKKMQKKKKKKAKGQAKDVFQSEEEDEDPYFVLMCLLSDLKSIREYIKEVWQEYKDGKVTLITASLTTNAAFDIIKTYLEDFPAMSYLLSDYGKTMEKILLRSANRSSKEELMLVFSLTMPFGVNYDDIGYMMSMGNALARMHEVADLTFASAFFFLGGPRDLLFGTLGDRVMVMNKYNSFGKYHPEQDRSKLTAAQEFQEDIQLLNYFAHGFYRVDEMHHSSGMTLDHISLQWVERPDLDAGPDGHKVTLEQALGSQILLDIHHVLREHVWHGFREMYEMSKKIDGNIARWKRDTSNDMFKVKYRERAVQLDEVMDMVQKTTKNIMANYESSVGSATKRNLNGSDILNSSFMALNPVLCGTMLFQVISVFRDSGYITAAFWKSIQSAGQLYYSCQMHRDFAKAASKTSSDESDIQLNLKTSLYWDDMEYLFKLHGREAFFQDHLPQTNEEIVKYVGNAGDDYINALGLIKKYAKGANAKKGFASFMKDNLDDVGHERGIGSYEAFNVTHALYYFKYSILHMTECGTRLTGQSKWKLETLQTLLENQLAKEAKTGGLKKSKKSKGKGNKTETGQRITLREEDGSVTQVTILRTLKETLQSESRIFYFDLLSFHLTCLLMLRTIRRVGQPTLEKLNGGRISGIDSYAGDEDFPDKMRDVIRIIHQPEAHPLQGPHSTNAGHVAIDSIIRTYLEANKCKDRQVKKIDSISGISPN